MKRPSEPQSAPAVDSTATRLLDAAAVLFAEKGYHGTSVREIAAAVGIQGGSIYNHFPGKEDMLFAIARETMREMLDGGRVAVSESSGPEERLRALVRFHVAFSIDHRVRARVADEQLHALDPERRAEVLAVRDDYEHLFRDVLELGRAEAGWAVADTAVVTFALATMSSAVSVWYRDDGRLSADRVATIYADLAARAVAGTPDT